MKNKEIMTINELNELGKKHGISEADIHTRLIENSIEISNNVLQELVELLGRPNIVPNYIEPWAREAEQRWLENEEYDEYYDFIDKFSKEKLNEVKAELGLLNDEALKKYKVKRLYYSYRYVTVEAHNEDEASAIALTMADDDAYLEIGKNATLEGVEEVTEVKQ